jgi:hypothetical protein
MGFHFIHFFVDLEVLGLKKLILIPRVFTHVQASHCISKKIKLAVMVTALGQDVLRSRYGWLGLHPSFELIRVEVV